MAKFLNTSALNYYLEELIKNSSKFLILISPYFKTSKRIRELLSDKDGKVPIFIVYGKKELPEAELEWLHSLKSVRLHYCQNLHAKCYMSQDSAILSSMNLYEFSQVNNNEMGINITREEDKDVFMDAYEEAKRLIRLSEIIESNIEEDQEDEETAELVTEKLTTSKLAKKNKMKTDECLQVLASLGYLDEDQKLTEKGKEAGGESKKGRFGQYFIWPSISLKGL